MIAGQIQMGGFSYAVGDGLHKVTGDKVKLLAFKENSTGFQVNCAFTPEEFDKFIQTISTGTLVIAHKLPEGKIIT